MEKLEELKEIVEKLYEKGDMNYKARDKLLLEIKKPMSDEEENNNLVYESMIQDGF
jgi:hypothetical protein